MLTSRDKSELNLSHMYVFVHIFHLFVNDGTKPVHRFEQRYVFMTEKHYSFQFKCIPFTLQLQIPPNNDFMFDPCSFSGDRTHTFYSNKDKKTFEAHLTIPLRVGESDV